MSSYKDKFARHREEFGAHALKLHTLVDAEAKDAILGSFASHVEDATTKIIVRSNTDENVWVVWLDSLDPAWSISMKTYRKYCNAQEQVEDTEWFREATARCFRNIENAEDPEDM